MSNRVIKVAVWEEGSLFKDLWPYLKKWEEQGVLEVVYILKEQENKIVFIPKGQMISGGGNTRWDFSASRYGLLAICRKVNKVWYPTKCDLEC